MKITKRIAKEVHNEKVKSFDEGYYKGKLWAIEQIKERLDINIELYKNQEIDAERLNCRIQGWLGHAKFANTFNLQNKIQGKLRMLLLNVVTRV